ncbi:MAG TPA: response regulator, partial [Clostridiales bacterium]|nr:response regulator [Clostridiales bacterium]
MKTKILIVDDELSSISNIKLLLSDSINYELAGDFSDPSQALLWLADHDVDIILSDMNMPKMNGVEFIRMIHNIRPDIQIIAISGYDDFDYVRGCMRLGVHDYLLKHRLSKDVLINTLDNVRQKLIPNTTSNTNSCSKNNIMKTIFDSKPFDPDKAQLLIDQNKTYIDTTYMIMIVINPDYNNVQGPDFENYASNASMIILDIARHVIANRHKYMTYTTGDNNVIILISSSDIAS